MWIPFCGVLLINPDDPEISEEYMNYIAEQKFLVVTIKAKLPTHINFSVPICHFTPEIFVDQQQQQHEQQQQQQQQAVCEKRRRKIEQTINLYLQKQQQNQQQQQHQTVCLANVKCLNFSPIHLDNGLNFDEMKMEFNFLNNDDQAWLLNYVNLVVIGNSCDEHVLARALCCGCRLLVHERWFGSSFQKYFEFNNVFFWKTAPELHSFSNNNNNNQSSRRLQRTPQNEVWDLRVQYSEDFIYQYFGDIFRECNIEWMPTRIPNEWIDIQRNMLPRVLPFRKFKDLCENSNGGVFVGRRLEDPDFKFDFETETILE